MLVPQFSQIGGLKDMAALECGEAVLHQFAQRGVRACPHPERQAEAVLGFVDDFVGEQVANRPGWPMPLRPPAFRVPCA